MTVTERSLDLAAQLELLSPVSLTELTARASLQTRVDRKYLLPLAQAGRVVELLGPDAHVLDIEGTRTFGYESVYFDTPELACYHLAARRRPARFKVRTRTYLDSGGCWLEVKTRDRRGRTVKQRTPFDGSLRGLTHDDLLFVDAALASAGIVRPPGRLEPALTTRYRRSTLLLPTDESRATIDTVLTFQERGGRRAGLVGRAVIESKTRGHTSDLDRLLWSHGHRPVQVSKYGTGLAALNPELPATKWRPVLRRNCFAA